MGDETASNFLSQAEFARRRQVSKKAVTVWKQKGLLVLREDGKVNVEETEWALDQRPASYRGGVTHRPARKIGNDRELDEVLATKPTPGPAQPAVSTEIVEEDGDPGAPDYLGSIELSISEAVRRKENALGLRRVHELEIAKHEWVRVEDVGLEVEREYATVRERVLTIPGKIASALVGRTQADIESLMRAEITEALNELHDPASVAGRVIAGGSTTGRAPDPSAAAGPQPH